MWFCGYIDRLAVKWTSEKWVFHVQQVQQQTTPFSTQHNRLRRKHSVDHYNLHGYHFALHASGTPVFSKLAILDGRLGSGVVVTGTDARRPVTCCGTCGARWSNSSPSRGSVAPCPHDVSSEIWRATRRDVERHLILFLHGRFYLRWHFRSLHPLNLAVRHVSSWIFQASRPLAAYSAKHGHSLQNCRSVLYLGTEETIVNSVYTAAAAQRRRYISNQLIACDHVFTSDLALNKQIAVFSVRRIQRHLTAFKSETQAHSLYGDGVDKSVHEFFLPFMYSRTWSKILFASESSDLRQQLPHGAKVDFLQRGENLDHFIGFRRGAFVTRGVRIFEK